MFDGFQRFWVENYNLKAENCCKLFIEFIDPCLTSIYQPPDVVMNAPLKAKIRTQYHDHVRRQMNGNDGIKAGDVVKISCELLVHFIETAFNEINEDNKKTRSIAASFQQCGLDPFVKDDSKFQEHLESLSEDGVYKALTDAHKALLLEEKF